MDVQQLYQQVILDHSKAPHGAGLREPYATEVRHVNPTCGDEITLRVQVDDGIVTDVSYEPLGCSISVASASVMAETVTGQPVDDALQAYDRVLELLQSKGQGEPDPEVLGDAVAFAGVARFPARVKCALLGWAAMRDAVLTTTTSDSTTTTEVHR
ncbi:SUF system NifU family Fe-S cluster assembly protein [Angustibacter speluncae]